MNDPDLSKFEPGFGYSVEIAELEQGAKVSLIMNAPDAASDVFVRECPTYIQAERVHLFLSGLATLLNNGMPLEDLRVLFEDAADGANQFGGALLFPGYRSLRLYVDDDGTTHVFERTQGKGGFAWTEGHAVQELSEADVLRHDETFDRTVDAQTVDD
jgi:hypothetical protein